MLVNLLPTSEVEIKLSLSQKQFIIVIRLFLVKDRTFLLYEKINIINSSLFPLPSSLLTPKNKKTLEKFYEIGITLQ